MIVPTLRVVTPMLTLRVQVTRSATECMPTQGVGMITITGPMIVPTLRVVTPMLTLRVQVTRSVAGCMPTHTVGTIIINQRIL